MVGKLKKSNVLRWNVKDTIQSQINEILKGVLHSKTQEEIDSIQFEIHGIIKETDEKDIIQEVKNYISDPWSLSIFDNVRRDTQFEIEHLEKPYNIQKGIFKCPRCGSNETMSIEVQTRRADESTTNFVTCCNPKLINRNGQMIRCGHKWKQ